MRVANNVLVFILVLSCFGFITRALASTEVAVTFDDLPAHGPIPDSELQSMPRLLLTKKIIATLNKHRLSGVYGFANPNRLTTELEHLAVLKEWINSGNILGNHTLNHANISEMPSDTYKTEIDLADQALHELARGTDYKWFRFPFLMEGETYAKRNSIRNYLSASGYKTAQVTISFQDHAWNPAYVRCIEKHDSRAINRLRDSYLESARSRLHHAQRMTETLGARSVRHILLLHVSAFDAEMLDELLSLYESLGVRFVSLAYAAQDPIYRVNPNRLYKRGSTFLDQLIDAYRKPYPKAAPLPLEELAKICK